MAAKAALLWFFMGICLFLSFNGIQAVGSGPTTALTVNVSDGNTTTPADTDPTPSPGTVLPTPEPAGSGSEPAEDPASSGSEPTAGPTEEPERAEKPTVEPTEEPEPALPTAAAEPLTESGSLLTAATDVGRLCPCDEHSSMCDMNCCCDRDCGEEVALFTRCSVTTVSGNKQLCSPPVAAYSLGTSIYGYSELQSSVRTESTSDVFCIHSQNRVDGFSHPSPALPTDSNFDSLFEQFTDSVFGLEDRAAAAGLRAAAGYEYGEEMRTAGRRGDTGIFWLPAPGVTADCVDTNPAAFLKDEIRACSRRVVLDQDCQSLPALNMDTYTNTQLFAGKNEDAAVVPVELGALVLQSAAGTQTELEINGEENLTPVLLNSDICANVVLKVVYVMTYSPAGEIMNVTVSLLLGFVSKSSSLPLNQEFEITFVQQDVEDVPVHYSGNPGYVVGRPLMSGSRTPDGIVRSIDPRETLSLLGTAVDQDCLKGPHQRSPVLFGLDSVSGCTLRLEDVVNCSLVSQQLLDVLRGPNYPLYVASFGNTPLSNQMEWVQIKNSFSPEEAQSCSIPLSHHLEIEWTKYGSLVNAQPQIVSIREIIQSNSSSLTLLSGGSSITSITTSVAFIPVSAPALPGYRATPTINAKLPYDFFFPFV
ncbi:tectonic-1 isoform X2 [Solea solea]|uniref:tectonic-1 isoform X2 n=1 Tax=Solea solea TaxID=90069 RepID=UPI00272C9A2D|nr:tectonic-1 isoform X2 [Solea solea]